MSFVKGNDMRNPWLQAVTLILVAAVLSVAVNAFAGRTRKLTLPGYYPNALRVPAPQPASAPPLSSRSSVPPATNGPAIVPSSETTTIVNLPADVPATATTAPAATATHSPVTTTAAATTATIPAQTPAVAPAIAAKPSVEQNPLERFPPHPDKPSIDVRGDDVAWLHGKGALFLDARRTSIYEQGHIAGARSFSVWESDIDEKVNKLYEERSDPRDQNLPIVIYCSGGACEDSHMLAQKLWGLQFNNVYVYKDGFPDWQKRGGAMKTGATP